MEKDINCETCGEVIYRIQQQPGPDGEPLNFVSREPDDYTSEGMPIYRCGCGYEVRPGISVPGGATFR